MLPCSPNTAYTEGDPRNWEVFGELPPGGQPPVDGARRAPVPVRTFLCWKACESFYGKTALGRAHLISRVMAERVARRLVQMRRTPVTATGKNVRTGTGARRAPSTGGCPRGGCLLELAV